MAVRTRGRRPKAEIQEEFGKIKEDSEQDKLSFDAKAAELAKLHDAEVKKAVSDITVEDIVQNLANLGLEVSKALSSLSTKLVEQTELLNSVRAAVTFERKELERLHKIDVVATATDYLIEEYDIKKKQLNEEIETVRKHWEEEQEVREREQKEYDDSLKKNRAREKEEFEYQKGSERKKEHDKYEEEQHVLGRKNKEKQEALEKSWTQREAVLKEKEEELARLKTEVTQFPERLKKDMDKVIAETTRTLESKHKQDMLLFQKEIETEKRLAELKNKPLEEAVSRQFAQIEALQARLEEAKKQVQDIAVKAIEGASGARALAHVNQIAMEQAKTRTTSS